uniref:Uncharacterized protein n=1 Tax=Salix viminalis TaxID=40686 RepID=A0A6N2KSN8_SALVM
MDSEDVFTCNKIYSINYVPLNNRDPWANGREPAMADILMPSLCTLDSCPAALHKSRTETRPKYTSYAPRPALPKHDWFVNAGQIYQVKFEI